MKAPSIADMRNRYTLEAPQRASDGAGGVYESWQSLAEIWGSMTGATGFETFTQGRIDGRVSHEICIRARADVAPGLRLRLGQRLFDIRAVLLGDTRRTRLRLLCDERDL